MKMHIALALVCLASFTVHAGKGKVYPAEWSTHSAMVSNYEVIQLTSANAVNYKLYFNANSYVAALNAIIFTSTRNGNADLYLVSLDNGSITQLTNTPHIGGPGANVCAATQQAFYVVNNVIKTVNLVPPFTETSICTIDSTYEIANTLSISSDGSTLALSLYDSSANSTTIALVNVKNGSIKNIWQYNSYLDHVVINPVESSKILFHGYNTHDIGIINVDGTHEVVFTQLNQSTVHPFWYPKGLTVAYALNGLNTQPVGQEVIAYNIKTKNSVTYGVSNYSDHFNANVDETMLLGDGGPGNAYIYSYSIDTTKNMLNATALFEHSRNPQSPADAEPVFINDTNILFNGDLAGNSNVYLLRKKVSQEPARA
jgi:Tol biopolymer transport system component